MDSAASIRDALEQVRLLRARAGADVRLSAAVRDVKELQSRRFRGSYADLLRDSVFQPAARFFLDELYGAEDYSERDAQFSRIAGTIGTVFPHQVAQTAIRLATLHALTEQLDHALAAHWVAAGDLPEARRYVQAWRATGSYEARRRQLSDVLTLGEDLTRLTRTPGLRLMLRMMRKPAGAAGLGSLQQFLEAGFDTFHTLAHGDGAAARFLSTVAEREAALLEGLSDGPLVASETMLERLLGQAR